MNIFQRMMVDQAKAERSLGNPLRDPAAIERRMNVMATMAGGKGFPVPAKEPRTDAQGRTRGERKRAIREAAKHNEIERRKAEEQKRAERVARLSAFGF